MHDPEAVNGQQIVEAEWVTFKGGELQGRRPHVLCPLCRAKRAVGPRRERELASKAPLCFGCYRAAFEFERRVKAAAALNTASAERFQHLLPLDSVNRARLARLRVERAAARRVNSGGVGRFVDHRRRAQIAARHALQGIAAEARVRMLPVRAAGKSDAALRALELQLPEAWLPFVVSR